MIENRPWGYFDVLSVSDHYKVKEIVVEPSHRLSLQYHEHRSEVWFVAKGSIVVYLDGVEFTLNEGEQTYIPLAGIHRISNNSSERAVVVEIQYGNSIDEDDIVRVEDDYNRTK